MCGCRCRLRREDLKKVIEVNKSVIKSVALLENTASLSFVLCDNCNEIRSTAVIRKIHG